MSLDDEMWSGTPPPVDIRAWAERAAMDHAHWHCAHGVRHGIGCWQCENTVANRLRGVADGLRETNTKLLLEVSKLSHRVGVLETTLKALEALR